MQDQTRRRPSLRRLAAGTALAVGLSGLALAAGAGPAAATTAPRAGARGGVRSMLSALTPAGAITGSSACTAGSGTQACTLYASAGALMLPGQVTPTPVWNFTTAPLSVDPTLGYAPAPGAGPVLVVNQGDQVSLTLTNTIPGEAVSLAIPGVGVKDDTTGAATGGSVTYSFKAGKPGTYLYEAGHTVNGAREAAMGLVGALIVRPSGFTSASQTDLGTAPAGVTYPANAFNDEAVLVLGEIDPAFAAAPDSFDLRNFNGTYRLINGRVYPNTAQIPTKVGNKVLLRYVNGGTGAHSMGTLGLRQGVVAIDHNASDGGALVADTLPPGETEDALVTVTDQGNYPVYDQSGELDTSSQLVSGTTQVATGGMMTLLGTDVVAPSADTVGPRSSAVTLNANPAKALNDVTVLATFTDPVISGVGGNAIAKAEAVIDQDVALAPGTGPITFTLSGSNPATGTATIPTATLQALSQGLHRVYVRAQDSIGNWGQPTSVVLNLVSTGATTSNLALTPNPANGIADATNLADPGGNVVLTATGDDSALGGTVDQFRYTFNGNTVTQNVDHPGTATSTETATVIPGSPTGPVPEGIYPIVVQTHDSFGLWGPKATINLTVDKTGPSASNGVVSPNPTDGTVGDPVDPTALKVSAAFTDPGITGTTPPSGASNVVAAEGFLQDPTDTTPSGCRQKVNGILQACANGTGFVFVANDGAFDSPQETAYGLIPLSTLTAYADGKTYTVWVHARDAAGNWDPSYTSISFLVKKTIFTNNFETGNTSLWNGGKSGNAAASGLTGTVTPLAGNYSLLVTGSGTTPSYVQDNSPATSSTATPPGPVGAYHARFMFSQNQASILRNGNAATTSVFTGYASTTGATPVFTVHYKRGNSGTAQVQLTVSRTGTTSTLSTSWLNLPTSGASSIQVDWMASTKATVTLTVNGTAASLTQVNANTPLNTSSFTVSSVRLGIASSGATVTGSALFDNFTSARNPLQ